VPSRKLSHPSSNRADRRPEPKDQTVFRDVVEDESPTELESYAVAKAVNCICRGDDVEPRNGSILYSTTRFPALERYGTFSANKSSKTGNVVTTTEDVFDADVVGNYIVWGNVTDEIIQYNNPREVLTRDSDTNQGDSAYIQGKLNLWKWHSKQEVLILQLADELWTANRGMTTYTKVIISSKQVPNNSESNYIEHDDDCLVANPAGIFKILLDRTVPVAYKINSAIPGRTIISNNDNGELNHKYRYFYSMSKLDGSDNFRSRLTPVKIQTESGLNEYILTEDEKGDWREINTEEPVGPGIDTYGILTGFSGIDTNPATWAAIHDGTARVSINNTPYRNLVFDFGGVVTMDEVAAVIQTQLRRYWSEATCQYTNINGPRMQVTSGKIKGGVVEYWEDGIGGTNTMATDLGLIRVRSTSAKSFKSRAPIDDNKIIRTLEIPDIKRTNTPNWHWTHYSVYRTADIGPEGENRDVTGRAAVNSPDFIVWVKDLRVMGSFIARRRNGIIEVRTGEYGEFERADVGSVVEFEDGTRVEITGYVGPKRVRYSVNPYYRDRSPWQAACIGNGRVARMVVNGTTVTRYPGSVGASFTSADVRKTIQFPNGTVSYIKSVTDANTFEINNTATWDETAITLDPTERNYNDIVNDEQLFGYAGGFVNKNRLFRPVEESSLILDQPGFVLFSAKTSKEIYYCQNELSYRQFMGYHNPDFQKLILEDQIQSLQDFPNRFSALCLGNIYTGVTNNSIEITVPETLQLIFQLRDMERVADFGLADTGTIARVGESQIRFMTNRDEIRDFDGIDYGPDLSVDTQSQHKKIKEALKKAYKQFVSIYSRDTGYILWWVRKDGTRSFD